MKRYLILATISILLAACGGGGGSNRAAVEPAPSGGGGNGGGSGGGNEDPFGLTQRASLATFNLPQSGLGQANHSLIAAYPNLVFSAPLFVAAVPGENRIVVVEQAGRIRVFEDSETVAGHGTAMDLSSRVLFSGEQGMLGLAFDPDFTNNRYIYVHYSADSPRRSVIARFTWEASTDSVNNASEKLILSVDQPFSNHNGGMLAFGPDDYLYIALGDGGSGGDPLNHSQDGSTLLGNILRVDVHPQNSNDAYDIPANNPFVSDSAVRDEIYALGLRNPFRFSFDRQTGTLWAGDVGQGSFEEIDIITAGGNYGWRVLEGNAPFDGSANNLPNSAFTPPVLEYPRSEGVSVTGGYVYRGNRVASLFGLYLYGDFSSGSIWALDWDGSQVVSNTRITGSSQITSFGETADSDVLVVSRNNGIFKFDSDSSGGGSIPTNLSETGLFTNLDSMTPAAGLIEYDVNHAFYSDDTLKQRWVGIPDNLQIDFTGDDWTLPLGSVLVKHFEIELTQGIASSTRRLETRILLNSDEGWLGFTYRWNSQESEAVLLSGRETEVINVTLASGGTRAQTYEYPSRPDCLSCHSAVEGFSLGLQTAQMNADFDYSATTDNQLRSFNNISLFSSDIGDHTQYDIYPSLADTTASTEVRARTYLDVNCSQCHQPGGAVSTNLDLRSTTANSAMNAISESPQVGDLGINNAQIIAPGDRQTSILWQRMNRTDGDRMPPLSSHVIDTEAVDVIGSWIDSL